jgi:ATP-dependent Lhr-like helicase
LPASGSDPAIAFDRLHQKVRRWIRDQGWTHLRDVQAAAIGPILDGDGDVVVAAATAGGKTEAAFLPIASVIADDGEPGFKAIYVSPLKALINDQWRRLDGLFERLDLPVQRWHGDVSQGAKAKARERPAGVILITPESLEALLIRRGKDIPRMFAALRFVVVDELHAFIGTDRGVHLQSLLKRLEAAAGCRPRRIGLSATLGDMQAAAVHLRPEGGVPYRIVVGAGDGKELRVQVRAFIEPEDQDGGKETALGEMASFLFGRLRGSSNLVFAGARQRVEWMADRLRHMAEEQAVPNEFFPHHGNLSRDLREELEARLRDGRLPTTAVCTTTLELGIDIGGVESVAQIGPPRTIAALRQRLGRSGRREGRPMVLRICLRERDRVAGDHPFDRLRTDVVQAVAAVRLLVESWFEPPDPSALRLSTLVHQILALIAQHGGATAARLHRELCGPGPFTGITPDIFAAVLRSIGDPERGLIEQAPDGTLMLCKAGERIVDHYSFYAVFQSDEEYRVVHRGRVLGTVPVDSPLSPDSFIVFAGRRWKVLSVDTTAKEVTVETARGGVPPSFGGDDAGGLHDRLVEEIRKVYREDAEPGFLDATALDLLREGREAYRELQLDSASMLSAGDRVLLLPWVGSRRLETLALALQDQGLRTLQFAVGIEITDCSSDEVAKALERISVSPTPDPVLLARHLQNKAREKFDAFLGDDLLCRDYASRRIDASGIPDLAVRMLIRDLRARFER